MIRLSSGSATSRFMLPSRKDFEIRQDYDVVLGVDVGVKRLVAVSIVDREGRVLKQLYLGQDVGGRQGDIDLRRFKLIGYVKRGVRSCEAQQCLRRLRKYGSSYTTTRCWLVAHEVVRLAERCNAFIVIEDLGGLKDARGNREGNRKSRRMPYHRFRVALESVAGQCGI